MNNKSPILGILGGLGPMSTVYFYEMITEHTLASCDQEHIDIVISSRASTPDRTKYIIGQSDDNPLDRMIEDAQKLINFGADLIAIPCNTAHYFYDKLQIAINIPILNIIYETVSHIKKIGSNKVGILATNGTISTKTYQNMCDVFDIKYEIPDLTYQGKLMDIIYCSIKSGSRADMSIFFEIVENLQKKGCDHIILGCTELSLIKRDEKLDSLFVDSLEVLAHRTILACEKTPVGLRGDLLCI